MRLNDVIAFPDPESLATNILYGWSAILGQFGICSFICSFVRGSYIYFFVWFKYIGTLDLFFSLTSLTLLCL